jgi:ThiS family
MSVNQEYAGPEAVLRPGDEVALLPPVSGGSSPAHSAIVRYKLIRKKSSDASSVRRMAQP